MALTARRTSRRPRRTSRVRRNTKRTSRPPTGSARKGRLKWKHVTATALSSNDPMFQGPTFKGRIRVDRGAGVLEFPNATQFQKIAREEGVPSEQVDKAFGHLLPKKAAKKKVRKNARRKRTVRRDLLSAAETLKGEKVDFTARTYEVDPKDVGRFGFRKGVMLDVGGKVSFLSAEDAMRRSYRWFSKQEFQKAFGYLMRGKLLGERTPSRAFPKHFGPRTMRLGYWSTIELHPESGEPFGQGDLMIDRIVPGQLVLIYKPRGWVAWQALVDLTDEDKPILVKFGARSRHMEWSKAFNTARVDRNIPALAFIEAFGFLLRKKERKELIREFATRP